MAINVSEALDSDTAVIITLSNTSSGGYVDGIYVQGGTALTKAIASVQQPTPKQMDFLEGGERTKDVKTFYLNKEVITSKNGNTATKMIHRGKTYKTIHVGDWEDYGWFFAMGARV